MSGSDRAAMRVHVQGVVQGVGFRPFAHRLARRFDLAGWIRNDGDGATIHLEGQKGDLERFPEALRKEAPRPIRIDSLTIEDDISEHLDRFSIRAASDLLREPATVRVPPDQATCSRCLDEVFNPADRRYRYPFTTCTACGPRYSIIESLPYERSHTTMRGFPLCSACARDFADPQDRRFHAEPIACPACGPQVRFFATLQPGEVHHNAKAIKAAVRCLELGEILALQGLGGFQLLVRADRSEGITRLRRAKHRPTKPLAVMVASLSNASTWPRLSAEEMAILQGPENPILLAESGPGESPLAAEVAPGLRHTGVMLPTTPLHHLILTCLDFPVVATSGNRGDEPILIAPEDWTCLAEIADAFLVHDRPIHRRVDDSVVRLVDENRIMLRLGRGYAPLPLPAMERWARMQGPLPPIVATGGQQKVALALWNGRQAVLSAHIGDMDDPTTRGTFRSAVMALAQLYACLPERIAIDLHPDYFTTQYAEQTGLPMVRVQHHHAHATACMAEHDLLDRTVLALTWDGTGLGTDGTIWGGEVLRARVGQFARIASLRPFLLPGGEAAIKEPARIALALLAEAYDEFDIPCHLLHHTGLSSRNAGILLQMIRRRVHSPVCTSMGRLFDGMAALIIPHLTVSYEGEAGARLEAWVDPHTQDAYPLPCMVDGDGMRRGDWRVLIRALVSDLSTRVPAEVCAARFHNALAQWAGEVLATEPEVDVVLGGGCFQNAWLMRRVRQVLERTGKHVYLPNQVPPGDGGLAVGQLAVALHHVASRQKG